MLRIVSVRRVKMFPQVQLGTRTQFVPEVHAESSSSSPTSYVDDIADLRKRLDWRLWNAMATKEWHRWEATADLYKEHQLELDEVSYTLMLHGYLLSHHHPASVSLLVLDRMKADGIHPAIVRLNESLVTSFFELSDMGVKSSANGWQNLARLAWMSAARLRKKRMRRVRQYLQSLPTEEVLKLTESDVKRLIDSEHALAQVIAADPLSLGEFPDEEGSDDALLDH